MPNSSKTWEDPDFDDRALFPCFATIAPAPAATNVTAVEILNVPELSPPVPHVSIASTGTSTLKDFSLRTSTPQIISSMVIPLLFNPIKKFSISISLAFPSKIKL